MSLMPTREEIETKRKEWRQLRMKLKPTQLRLLKAYADNDFKMYSTGIGMGISRNTLHNWLKNPDFCRARDMLIDEVWERADESKASIIATTAQIRNRCMQSEPVRDADGNEIGIYKFDPQAALKANEMLSKWRGMMVDKVEHSGPDGGPIQTAKTLDVSGIDDEQLRALSSIKIHGE